MEYGPLKPYEEQGYTEEQLDNYTKTEDDNMAKQKTEIIKNGVTILMNPDPTGRRTGEGMEVVFSKPRVS